LYESGLKYSPFKINFLLLVSIAAGVVYMSQTVQIVVTAVGRKELWPECKNCHRICL